MILRPWQLAALESWRANGHRGIVAAATGTGKTIVAVEAIKTVGACDYRTIVVVPKAALVPQWQAVIHATLGLRQRQVGVVAAGSTGFDIGNRVVIAVINSARRAAANIVGYWQSLGSGSLLVVDECHWSGSLENSRVLQAPFAMRLGLSATPEREDGGFESRIEPLLGPVVYRYPVRQALDDGLLAPLQARNIYFDLQGPDRNEYLELSDRISTAVATLCGSHPHLRDAGPRWLAAVAALAGSDPAASRLQGLIGQRRRLVASARTRGQLMRELVAASVFEGRRALLFHETIASATATHRLLAAAGIRAAIEHSGLPPSTRSAAFRRFAAGAVDAIAVVRTADEGIDVPEADLAIIASGTLTPRQRIQRIGRILRPANGPALCITFLARGTTEESYVGARDDELLGGERVAHHRWPATSLPEILRETPTATPYAPRAEGLL